MNADLTQVPVQTTVPSTHERHGQILTRFYATSFQLDNDSESLEEDPNPIKQWYDQRHALKVCKKIWRLEVAAGL